MNPYLLYVKLGAAALVLAIVGGTCYRLGGNASRAALETDRAAQLSAVATAYENQVLARAAGEAKLQKVQDAYDAIKDLPNPLDTGLAHRVYIAAAGGCPVPRTAAVASGTQTPAPIPRGDPGVVGRLQDLIDACRADAAQLSAMIELAP